MFSLWENKQVMWGILTVCFVTVLIASFNEFGKILASIAINFFMFYCAKSDGLRLSLEHKDSSGIVSKALGSLIVSIVLIILSANVGGISGSLIFIYSLALSGLIYSGLVGYAYLLSLDVDYSKLTKTDVYLGHTLSSFFPKAFFLSELVRKQHQIIFGTTGAAKTEAVIIPQVDHDIRTGKMVVILDLKGDLKFRNKVFSYCQKYNRKFHYFSLANPEISDSYNPFLSGTPAQIKDKLMTSTDWPDSGGGLHYKKISKLQFLVSAMKIKEKITIEKLIPEIPDTDDFTGLIADLKLLNLSPVSHLMNNEKWGILDIYNENKVFFVSLEEDLFPDESVSLARVILADLKALSGYINSKVQGEVRREVSVFVDEFASLLKESLLDPYFNFLSKVRSARMMVVMSTQSVIGDLQKYGDYVLSKLIDLTSTHIIMGGSDPKSAEYLANMIGSVETKNVTMQTEGKLFNRGTGKGTVSEGEEYIVNPNQIKNLRTGNAYIHIRDQGIIDFLQLDHFFHDDTKIIDFESYKLAH